MQIDRLVVGDLETNCYVLTKNDQTIIIDPGAEADKILNFCSNKNVIAIFITHYHFDHIEALTKVQQKFSVPINPLKIPNWDYEIIKTPGHKEDCLSFYFPKEQVMFVGDFIFYHSIGRVDLAGGNIIDMQKSLELIKLYPDNITLYPGHGIKTNLGYEKRHFNNYF